MNRNSKKEKPPLIRQTKASLFRIIKANQFIFYDKNQGNVRSQVIDFNLPKNVFPTLPITNPTKTCGVSYESKGYVQKLQKYVNQFLDPLTSSVVNAETHVRNIEHTDSQYIPGLNEDSEGNKENVEPDPPLPTSSNEDLNCLDDQYIINTNNSENVFAENETPIHFVTDSCKHPEEALKCLHNLIQNNHPKKECEQMLNRILIRFPNAQDNEDFWECKVLLNMLANTIQPILQVTDQFANLVITPKLSENKTEEDCASTLKFALTQSMKKKNRDSENGCTLIATPVRRCTRKSRTGYVHTPKTEICSTLKDLSNEVRSNIKFRSNKSLL